MDLTNNTTIRMANITTNQANIGHGIKADQIMIAIQNPSPPIIIMKGSQGPGRINADLDTTRTKSRADHI